MERVKRKGKFFLNEYLISLLNTWKANRINISKKNKLLSYKQINCIVKYVSFKYFKKIINPHDLRRSFATNLLRNHVDLKTISYLLGHSNINTTSRYIFFTVDEIHKNIKNIF
ncbi:tyrosine-type recombinase/integrase [Mycoplasmoides alvi]|uniref:tyrosine-type recombinase/integrase n=1 Tax=Mycoplasmoides alvi TaxID=78580 RepID=UPI00051B45A0